MENGAWGMGIGHWASDGRFVKNFQEHPQSILLTDSLETTFKMGESVGVKIGMSDFSAIM
jgi:hypothetical protein